MSSCNKTDTPETPDARWCTIDVPESGEGDRFEDILTLNDATMKLQAAVATSWAQSRPFFLGVGLRKPHMDWRFPRPFLNRYPAQADIDLPLYPTARPHVPQIALHDASRSDSEEKQWHGYGYRNPWAAMPNDTMQVRPAPECSRLHADVRARARALVYELRWPLSLSDPRVTRKCDSTITAPFRSWTRLSGVFSPSWTRAVSPTTRSWPSTATTAGPSLRTAPFVRAKGRSSAPLTASAVA